jgi:hypothetical protein
MYQWRLQLTRKQKAFRASGPFQRRKYARERFVEDSRQSINFVFSRKRNLVRKGANSVLCYVEKDFIRPISLHGDISQKKGYWKPCHPGKEDRKGKDPIHQPVALPNLSEKMKSCRKSFSLAETIIEVQKKVSDILQIPLNGNGEKNS